MKKLVLCVLFASACGGDDGGGRDPLFTPKPECMGASITPFQGTNPQVISKLAIGTIADGFDLDGDGKPDNKLSGVSSLAQDAIDDSLKNYDILIPIEYFDFPTVGKDECVKFAIYLADYAMDKDADGKKSTLEKGDCNDNVAAIKPGAPEEVGDGIDNDCDGLADEDGQNTPNGNTDDADQDGRTIADGDCDDHNNTVNDMHAEVCGDGLDNDCDGVADRTADAMGNVTACSPFDGTQDLQLDPLSIEAGQPLISFKDGTVDAANKLVAGPSIFSVNIPVLDGVTLDLRITGATIEGTLAADGTTMNGRLGGVIDAKTADTVRGLDVSQIGLTPDNSLLDATFANLLGPLLSLPKAGASILKTYPNCRTPDIDVDGDGLEAFCDSDPNDDDKSVNVCIDGDGTVVKDGDNGVAQCSEAMKDGKPRFVDIRRISGQRSDEGRQPRFVDGISVEIVLDVEGQVAQARDVNAALATGVGLARAAADLSTRRRTARGPSRGCRSKPLAGEDPSAYVARIAHAKAIAVKRRPGRGVVLAADTTVTIDGRSSRRRQRPTRRPTWCASSRGACTR